MSLPAVKRTGALRRRVQQLKPRTNKLQLVLVFKDGVMSPGCFQQNNIQI